jgi:Uma2 family endonuclease
MSVQVERWIFKADDYHRMAEAGILSEDDRVELVGGEIVRMSPIGYHHIACVNRLTNILAPKLGQLAMISVQNPIRLDDYSEPQPDITLLERRRDFYSGRPFTSDDVLLVIEVSVSSVDYDRNVKVPLYARAGIPEVWLAILPEDHLEAYGRPVNGSYQDIRIVRRGESLSPQRLPNLMVSVEEILGGTEPEES